MTENLILETNHKYTGFLHSTVNLAVLFLCKKYKYSKIALIY